MPQSRYNIFRILLSQKKIRRNLRLLKILLSPPRPQNTQKLFPPSNDAIWPLSQNNIGQNLSSQKKKRKKHDILTKLQATVG